MVEGYFDFAQVFQSEAAPAVASCGTALTAQQAQALRRFTTKVVLSFDPDTAGQGAATRSCEMLVAEGFEVNAAHARQWAMNDDGTLTLGEMRQLLLAHGRPVAEADRFAGGRPGLRQ
jgi:DNA primase